MKRTCFAILALMAVFMMACPSTPKTKEPERMTGLPEIVRNARKNAPEGVLIGVGSAKLATMNQSKTVAETRARAEISRAMNTMVQDMVRDYTASSEVDTDAAISFQEQITVALSQATLTGAVIQDEDFIDGTYYIVMYLSKADTVREISQAQAAARLAIPAMASFSAEARMEDAFDRQSNRELGIADRDY